MEAPQQDGLKKAYRQSTDTDSASPTRKRALSLPAKSEMQVSTAKMSMSRGRSNSLDSTQTNAVLNGYQRIIRFVEQHRRSFNARERNYIRNTLRSLETLDKHADFIAAADNPRYHATRLAGNGVEDGFNKGESAEHLRANIRLLIDNFPATDKEAIELLKTITQGDPCLTGRMGRAQAYITQTQLGDIQIDGVPDPVLSRKIFELWQEYEETCENSGVQPVWATFTTQLPDHITTHGQYVASLRWAKEAVLPD